MQSGQRRVQLPTKDEVLEGIRKLKSSKSTGKDELAAEVIKESGLLTATELYKLMNGREPL